MACVVRLEEGFVDWVQNECARFVMARRSQSALNEPSLVSYFLLYASISLSILSSLAALSLFPVLLPAKPTHRFVLLSP